ncbi:MAG: hypothetical protein A3G43_05290 [Ignavibacteria bacterium RIFCSPLOWO2_12_FULL_56_21]|nr:MAG: hypothetical protein A2X68_08650 [Ignavibacteria bacterium GWC2_56_12]OGU75208.1 MAG: hypothetical protein A3G43_05290 [Ignavibacteria bacterium RIFCSPLOWO2_12_FULL_56_21]
MASPPRRFDSFRFLLKPLAFFLAATPFLFLLYNYYTDNLSVNPLDDITDTTGTWTLRMIVITLTMTPLRKITGWSGFSRLRRMSGVYAFFYGTMHLMTYLYFDKFFEWGDIADDLTKRRFIIVGFTAWSLMLPLALTSTDRMTKWVGGKNWKRLHRLVYVTAICGVIHYLWLVKADLQRPLTYGAIVAVLLGYRIVVFVRGRYARREAAKASSVPPAASLPVDSRQ